MYFILLVLFFQPAESFFFYQYGYLFFIVIQMSRLPEFTLITVILQPQAEKFMYCLKHVLSKRDRAGLKP